MRTPVKRRPCNATNEMETSASQQTPLSFSRELRQVLQERNLLTAKSRRKVCALLDGSNCSSTAVTPNTEMDKRKTFRLQAIQEIVSSEKTYLNHLEILMQYFVRPLKAQAIIGEVRHTALFGQIEMIHNLNGELLRELEANMDNVAGAFLKMAPFLKLYSVYAFDYKNSLLILQDITSKNPVFRQFLEQTESRPEVQRKLNSLMIVPIQRVPRYKLLLEQVLLYTSPADADFKLLKESVKQIESTVSHINSCIEDQEVTQLLINLQNSLVNRTPNIVKPSRKVIKEGMLQKVTHSGNMIKRYCVLMSDIFMYCKVLKERLPNTVVENSLECCCIFPLKKCKVYELFPGNFKVTCQGDGILLCTQDLQLQRAWVGFIRDAIDLHIQCRKTLRKESSKKKPIRKKDMKKFDTDFVLSPNKRKCEYETVFRNKNRSTDSENEDDGNTTSVACFSFKKNASSLPAKPLTVTVPIGKQNGLKRTAPPPPDIPNPTTQRDSVRSMSTKSISNLYKLIVTEKKTTRGILKRSTMTTNSTPNPPTTDQPDAIYGFATRCPDGKSYFRATNVDSTIPTAGSGNIRDMLYPLRSSGSSIASKVTWSLPQTEGDGNNILAPPQRKRVKFEINASNRTDASEIMRLDFPNNNPKKPKPYEFAEAVTKKSSSSLRDRIYNFFAKLF